MKRMGEDEEGSTPGAQIPSVQDGQVDAWVDMFVNPKVVHSLFTFMCVHTHGFLA